MLWMLTYGSRIGSFFKRQIVGIHAMQTITERWTCLSGYGYTPMEGLNW